MKKNLKSTAFLSIKDGKEKFLKLSSEQKSALEKTWDIEHAYYSSVLEGSNLDRKEFEKLGEKVA